MTKILLYLEKIELARDLIELGLHAKTETLKRDEFKERFVIDYNVELFPGLYMKTKCKAEPTMILFRTGSYTIMGCKSINQVKEYKLFIINLLNHFMK